MVLDCFYLCLVKSAIFMKTMLLSLTVLLFGAGGCAHFKSSSSMKNSGHGSHSPKENAPHNRGGEARLLKNGQPFTL